MKNAVILHGKPKKEKYLNLNLPQPHQANWLPWLAEQLEQHGIHTAIPAFPDPYAPDYRKWAETFERCHVDENTGLIGHSAGAGFIVRWLSENPGVSVENAILVAPWHDRNHEYGRRFFDYEIDRDLPRRVGSLAIVNSIDDGESIQESVHMLLEMIPGISYIGFDGYGHFMLGNKMETREFPFLLDLVLAEDLSVGSRDNQD